MCKGFTLIELMIVIAIISIIAAIAIPNLLESRITSNEAAASASLKSGVFPAQIQFQSGGYQDSDLDNVGEYGTIGALAGTVGTTKGGTAAAAAGDLKLVNGPLASGTATQVLLLSNGYLFTSWAPNHTSISAGATTSVWTEGDAVSPTACPAGEDAGNGERFFQVACAAQDYGNSGRRGFVISQDGQVRSPAIPASANQFYGVTTTPASGATPTQASLRVAMALSVGKTTYADTILDAGADFNAFPVYSK